MVFLDLDRRFFETGESLAQRALAILEDAVQRIA